MNAKKILRNAVRKTKHKKELEKMSEAQAEDLLRSLNDGKKEDKQC